MPALATGNSPPATFRSILRLPRWFGAGLDDRGDVHGFAGLVLAELALQLELELAELVARLRALGVCAAEALQGALPGFRGVVLGLEAVEDVAEVIEDDRVGVDRGFRRVVE